MSGHATGDNSVNKFIYLFFPDATDTSSLRATAKVDKVIVGKHNSDPPGTPGIVDPHHHGNLDKLSPPTRENLRKRSKDATVKADVLRTKLALLSSQKQHVQDNRNVTRTSDDELADESRAANRDSTWAPKVTPTSDDELTDESRIPKEEACAFRADLEGQPVTEITDEGRVTSVPDPPADDVWIRSGCPRAPLSSPAMLPGIPHELPAPRVTASVDEASPTATSKMFPMKSLIITKPSITRFSSTPTTRLAKPLSAALPARPTSAPLAMHSIASNQELDDICAHQSDEDIDIDFVKVGSLPTSIMAQQPAEHLDGGQQEMAMQHEERNSDRRKTAKEATTRGAKSRSTLRKVAAQ